MELKNIWRSPENAIRAYDKNRDEFIVAWVLGSIDASPYEFAGEIVRAVNSHSELFDLIDEAVTAFDQGGDYEAGDWLDRARAALAKAGEPFS